MTEPVIPRDKAFDDDPPPVFGSWNRIYLFIVIYLVALITAFGVFTAVYNK